MLVQKLGGVWMKSVMIRASLLIGLAQEGITREELFVHIVAQCPSFLCTGHVHFPPFVIGYLDQGKRYVRTERDTAQCVGQLNCPQCFMAIRLTDLDIIRLVHEATASLRKAQEVRKMVKAPFN